MQTYGEVVYTIVKLIIIMIIICLAGFTIKDRTDRKHSFEINTPTQPLVVLQAESEDDFNTWMAALRHVQSLGGRGGHGRAASANANAHTISYAIRTPPPASAATPGGIGRGGRTGGQGGMLTASSGPPSAPERGVLEGKGGS